MRIILWCSEMAHVMACLLHCGRGSEKSLYGAVKRTVDKHAEGVVKVPTERAAELQRHLTAQ